MGKSTVSAHSCRFNVSMKFPKTFCLIIFHFFPKFHWQNNPCHKCPNKWFITTLSCYCFSVSPLVCVIVVVVVVALVWHFHFQLDFLFSFVFSYLYCYRFWAPLEQRCTAGQQTLTLSDLKVYGFLKKKVNALMIWSKTI